MSRPKSSFWKCPKCGRTFRARSGYHLKSCNGPGRQSSMRCLGGSMHHFAYCGAVCQCGKIRSGK
jgi:hypothetical protein